ncbi:MAG: NAD(P)/FAD-dependent oxidoreductase [Endomicrobiaceae bacterium]|nr:NAD(P)/FAD-dependent oxidoreductase [Endomicrobiaceae bacterium]
MNKKNALIIGAGPAGLTAAYELLTKTNIKPIIIESTNDIGGISKTFDYKNNKMDMGGHRFFSKSDVVMNWWTNLMPIQTVPSSDDILLDRKVDLSVSNDEVNPNKIDDVMLVRNRLSRIFFLKNFFDYPISLSIQTMKNLGALRIIKIGISYSYSLFVKRQEKNLEDFMINRFGKELYLTFFKDYTHKVWGVEPKDIPSDWGTQRIKGLSILKLLQQAIKKVFTQKTALEQKDTETSLIEKFYYPKYGPGHFWQLVAKKIEDMGGKILFNQKATRIITDKNRIKSVVVKNEESENEYTSDYFFSTMPVKDLISSLDKKDSNIEKISKGLGYRSFITIGLLVKKLEIINNTKIKSYKNRVPDEWIYIQEREVKLGRLQIFNNWSPYLVNDYENTVWIGLEYFCDEDDDMWNMKEKDFIKFASKELEQIGIVKAENILDGCFVKVPKAYPAYFGTYNEFDKVKKYINQYENLFLVGRNGMHKYNNMDHSMLTAITAVDNIIKDIKTKDNIWSVNTEQDYHESKQS